MKKEEYTNIYQYQSDVEFYKELIGHENQDFEEMIPRGRVRRQIIPIYNSKKRNNLIKFTRERILEKLSRSTIIKSKMKKDNLTLRDIDLMMNLNHGGARIFNIEKNFSDFFYFSENKVVKSWIINLHRTISSNAFRNGRIFPLRSLSDLLKHESGFIHILDGNFNFFNFIDDSGAKRYLIHLFIKQNFSKKEIEKGFNEYFGYEKSPRRKKYAEAIHNVLKHG